MSILFLAVAVQLALNIALPLAVQSFIYGAAVSLSLWLYRNHKTFFWFDLAVSLATLPLFGLTPLIASVVFAIALSLITPFKNSPHQSVPLKPLLLFAGILIIVDVLFVSFLYRFKVPPIALANLVPYVVTISSNNEVSLYPFIGSGDFAIPAYITLISNAPLISLPFILSLSTLVVEFFQPDLFPMLVVILPIQIVVILFFSSHYSPH